MQVATDWPGMVQSIHVSIGEEVTAEQELITLESMKMLQPVLAPAAGRVTAFHVAVGDFVNPGAPLLTLE